MGLPASTRQRLLAAAFLTVSITACGGGSDTPTGPHPPAPPPAPAPAPAPSPQAVNWGVFPSAVRVLGKDNFDDGSMPSGASPLRELNFPVGSPGVTSDGILFIAELGATQLKVFDQYMSADGLEAAFTFSVDNGIPSGVSVHGRRLVVLEDSMVAIYNDVPGAPPSSAPDATAGGTEGCSASQLNRPRSAYITPLGQLVVADTGNNRVLIWNEIPGAGDALGDASVVVGQVFKDKCAPNDFNGDGTSEGTPRAETLNQPTSVWSDGVKLIVADRNNHRVLIWDTFPADDFEAPDHVLGQDNFISGAPNAGLAAPTASSLADPMSVDVSESGQIAVVDRSNHRVLVWNAAPSARTAPADQVIGQPGPLAGAGSPASIRTLDEPSGVRFDGRNMIVVDTGNNRVLVFRALD